MMTQHLSHLWCCGQLLSQILQGNKWLANTFSVGRGPQLEGPSVLAVGYDVLAASSRSLCANHAPEVLLPGLNADGNVQALSADRTVLSCMSLLSCWRPTAVRGHVSSTCS